MPRQNKYKYTEIENWYGISIRADQIKNFICFSNHGHGILRLVRKLINIYFFIKTMLDVQHTVVTDTEAIDEPVDTFEADIGNLKPEEPAEPAVAVQAQPAYIPPKPKDHILSSTQYKCLWLSILVYILYVIKTAHWHWRKPSIPRQDGTVLVRQREVISKDDLDAMFLAKPTHKLEEPNFEIEITQRQRLRRIEMAASPLIELRPELVQRICALQELAAREAHAQHFKNRVLPEFLDKQQRRIPQEGFSMTASSSGGSQGGDRAYLSSLPAALAREEEGAQQQQPTRGRRRGRKRTRTQPLPLAQNDFDTSQVDPDEAASSSVD